MKLFRLEDEQIINLYHIVAMYKREKLFSMKLDYILEMSNDSIIIVTKDEYDWILDFGTN